MSLVVSLFPEVFNFISQPCFPIHAALICSYQSVCYMEDLCFILGLCNGLKQEHSQLCYSISIFPFLMLGFLCLDQPTPMISPQVSALRDGNTILRSTLMFVVFIVIILRLVVIRVFQPWVAFLQSSMAEGKIIVVPFNLSLSLESVAVSFRCLSFFLSVILRSFPVVSFLQSHVNSCCSQL